MSTGPSRWRSSTPHDSRRPSLRSSVQSCCSPDAAANSSVAELIKYDKAEIQSQPAAAASCLCAAPEDALRWVGDPVDVITGAQFDVALDK